jgi:chromosome partitioning protein
MGLFSRKKTDDGRRAHSSAPAQTDRTGEEREAERPPEPMSAVEAGDGVPRGADADGRADVPETAAEPRAERGSQPLPQPDAEMTPPEPEDAEPRVVRDAQAPRDSEEPDTASIEKEELRRAMGAPTKNGAEKATDAAESADQQRVSAEDLIAPTPQRRHPFTPEAVEERPAERRMKVYAFANQKGGVAKTTTALNLAVALSESGHDVLCVDLDPQGNLTMSQGIDPDEVEKSLYNVLVDRMPISEIIQHREIDIAVSSIDLAGAEIAMSTQIGRERSLQKALREVESDYDFVCIDTPPSLGLLTINALTAADKVIVPVQCEYLSMRGLVQLQNTLEMIRENLNPDVEIEGILPTMLDARTVHAKEAVEILEENFGELVFKSRIRKAIKFAEAPVKGSSVLKYDPEGNAAKYYRDLAEEVLTHGQAT